MPDDRLLIDQATTLQIASSLGALRVLIEHSSAYLAYVSSHVGHADLVAELDGRAAQLGDERERLGVLLDEIATQISDMVSEFARVDTRLGAQVPTPLGSPDAMEARARHGWESVTGVYIDAD